jgi:hypothetical protein
MWVNPNSLVIIASKSGYLHPHKGAVDDEGKVPLNEGCDGFKAVRVNTAHNYTDFNFLPKTGEVMEAHSCLIKTAFNTYNSVMNLVHITMHRNTGKEIFGS